MEKFYAKNKNVVEFSRARWLLFKQGGTENNEVTSIASRYEQAPEEIRELIDAVIEEFIKKNGRSPTSVEKDLLIQKALKEARTAQERVAFAAQTRELAERIMEEFTKKRKRQPTSAEKDLLTQLSKREAEIAQERMDFAAQTRELAEAKLLAETDQLTGLLNRRGLEARMNQLCALTERSDQSISFIAFDLDSFKRVNDGFGHGVGDSMLKHLSVILSRRARKMDLVVRQGGEEFLVVLPNTNENQALEVAESFRSVIEQDLKELLIQELPEEQRADAERLIKGTASIGVGTIANGDWKKALEQADDALYVAKKLRGKNTVVGVSQVTHEDRLAMEELRKEEALKSKAEKQAPPEKIEVDQSLEAQVKRTAERMQLTSEELAIVEQMRAMLQGQDPQRQEVILKALAA